MHDSPENKSLLDTESIRLLHELQHHRSELEMQNEELRNTVEKLRQSEERYRNIIENQAFYVNRSLPGGVLTFVNSALADLTGLPAESLVGRSYYPFIHEDDYKKTIQLVESITPENPSVMTEGRIVLPDGTIRWCSWNQTGIFDSQGNLLEYQSVGQDITGRKQAEIVLRENLHLLSVLFDSLPIAAGWLDADGNVEYLNKAFIELFGYSAEDIPTVLEWFERAYPDTSYREAICRWYADNVASTAEDAPIPPLNARVSCKNGCIKDVIIVASRIMSRTVAVYIDITERTATELLLKSSEERFRSIMALSPDIISILDENGTLIYNSPAALDVHGYTQEDMIGMNTLDFIHPEDLETVAEAMKKLISDPLRTVTVQYRYKNRNGAYDWMECRASNQLANPLVGGIIAISRGISDRKALEESRIQIERQLQSSQKMESLGVLAGGIAHDFNNILMIILGHANILKRSPLSTEKHLFSIENAVERGAELCRRMLAYAGRSEYEKTSLDMVMLVDDMIEMLRHSLNLNVQIRWQPSPDIPPINGDAAQLRQIVMNLVINAAEAIGDMPGEVLIRLDAVDMGGDSAETDYLGKTVMPGSYLCLQVSDNGCGMDETTRRKIFEPFYTTKFTGRGLGMSAVIGIVTAHEGAVQLFSKPGRGTTFKIFLPVHAAAPKTADAQTSPGTGCVAPGSVILLAEDEIDISLTTQLMLEEMGFKVIKAINGKNALTLFQKNSSLISMVLTDLNMPVMDGFELFARLRELRPGIPIIVSSGFGDLEVSTRIPLDERTLLLTKPYTFDTLEAAVSSIASSGS